MKASIDRSGCIGCTLCATVCPEVFFMADDGKADVSQTLCLRHCRKALKTPGLNAPYPLSILRNNSIGKDLCHEAAFARSS